MRYLSNVAGRAYLSDLDNDMPSPKTRDSSTNSDPGSWTTSTKHLANSEIAFYKRVIWQYTDESVTLLWRPAALLTMLMRDYSDYMPDAAPVGRERAQHSHRAKSKARNVEYFIPKDGIDRKVIVSDICHYLGNDALVRPGTYEVGHYKPKTHDDDASAG